MIGILDYGIGNIGSIKNMLHKTGERNVLFLKKPSDFDAVDKIILPGVGSFDRGMELLDESGLREALDENVLEKRKPVLGICLGMQMLGKASEEGCKPGLAYMDFYCKRFSFSDPTIKIPHMGWDHVEINKPESCLLYEIKEKPRFYFVHSYHAVCADETDVLLSCDYGYKFAAAVQRDNVYGTQFHPEKSHIFGLTLLKNFVERA